MSKFGSGVLVLLITAFVFLYTFPGHVPFQDDGEIRFTDFETECRLDGREADVNLRGKTIRFSGHFPTEHLTAERDYTYRQTSDSITLDILADDTESAEDRDFLDDCLASVVYDARTNQLEPGDYHVTLRHNGETVESQIIEVK